MAPRPCKTAEGDRLAFITYFKGEYKLHTQDTEEPVKEIDQEVRAASEGLVDFQPDITHEVIPENKRRKKLFEGLYLEGRPPINVGVTSSGDFFGGTAVALTDVLGDQLFAFRCSRSASTDPTTCGTSTWPAAPLRGGRLRSRCSSSPRTALAVRTATTTSRATRRSQRSA